MTDDEKETSAVLSSIFSIDENKIFSEKLPYEKNLKKERKKNWTRGGRGIAWKWVCVCEILTLSGDC